MLRCHAHGSPAPTIHWYKSVGGLAGEERQNHHIFDLDIPIISRLGVTAPV